MDNTNKTNIMKQILKEYVAIEDYLDEDGKTILIKKGTKLRQATYDSDTVYYSVDNSSTALSEQAIKESGAFRPIQLLFG